MSVLSKLIKKKVENEIIPEVQKKEVVFGKYNRKWLSDVCLFLNYEMSDDSEKVDKILEALNRKNGQCPCGGNGQQFRCPCNIMRENWICKCGLFKNMDKRKIVTSTSAIIKQD